MEDADLQSIRQARLAQLRQQGAGGASGGSSGPSLGGPRGGGGPSEEDREAQEDMKRQMLSRILDQSARERLSRIALVKQAKADAITNLLLQLAKSGQIRQQVSEPELIDLLNQVEQRTGGDNEPKITITRKKKALDDSDDDFDL